MPQVVEILLWVFCWLTIRNNPDIFKQMFIECLFNREGSVIWIHVKKKERRRQEILYAALELFVTKGYAATKITDIAKSANMSRGLMFHYFESKEKLYEELIRMGLEGTAYPGEQKCEHAIDFFMNFTEEAVCVYERATCCGKIFCIDGRGTEK